jgi:hypothetical protein
MELGVHASMVRNSNTAWRNSPAPISATHMTPPRVLTIDTNATRHWRCSYWASGSIGTIAARVPTTLVASVTNTQNRTNNTCDGTGQSGAATMAR